MSSPPEVKPELREKPKIVRRHGACEECKKSKIKCDGGEPCSTCRASKRKQKRCDYRRKAKMTNHRRSEHRRNSTMSRTPHNCRIDHPSDCTVQHSGHPTPNSISELSAQNACNGGLHQMGHTLSLSQALKEYPELVQPKPSYATLFERSQTCAAELSNHIISTPRSITPFSTAQNTTLKRKRPESGRNLGSIMNAWDDRYVTMEDCINDGHLAFARQEIDRFKQDIEAALERKGRPSQSQRTLQQKARDILNKLRMMDWKIGMFLGHTPILSSWAWIEIPGPSSAHIQEENIHAAKRIELLQTLQALFRAQVVGEASLPPTVQTYIEHHVADWQGTSGSAISAVASSGHDEVSEELPEQQLFSNLFLMAVYCRTANIERYCEIQGNRSGQGTSANDSVSTIDRLSRTRQPIRKSVECHLVIKHAERALLAFHRLCDIDSQTTAKCWFRLHGALTAAFIIGMGGFQKGKVTKDSNSSRILLKTQACFNSLGELNPGCPVIPQAKAFFDEVFKSEGKRIQASLPILSADTKVDMSMHSTNSFAMADPHIQTTQPEDSANDLQAPSVYQYQYRPPHIYPPSPSTRFVHPPMVFDPSAHPPGQVFFTPGLVADEEYYRLNGQNTEHNYPTKAWNDARFATQPAQIAASIIPFEAVPGTSEKSVFRNKTASYYEGNLAGDIRMLSESPGQASQPAGLSSFQAESSVVPSRYSIAPASEIIRGSTFMPTWQEYCSPPTSNTVPNYLDELPHDDICMDNSSVAYYATSDITERDIHPPMWPAHKIAPPQPQEIVF